MPSRISASLGSGFSCRRSIAAMIMPGVQKPHCRPCISWNAFCTGCRRVGSPMPSIVVTSDPSAWTASTVHDFTDTPSSSTVQEPQLLVSHPTTVPTLPSCSRR